MKPEASGSAHTAMIEVVDHAPPTDPKKLRAKRLKQADAAIASAKAKIVKQRKHVSNAPYGRKTAQRAHLKGAEQALAEAIAAKERIS